MHHGQRLSSGRTGALALVLTCTLALLTTPAHAGLNGDTITCTPGFSFPGMTLATSAVIVNPGVEFTLAQPSTPLFDFDFNGNTLTITARALNSISGPTFITFGDLDWIGDPPTSIIGLAIDPGSAVIAPGGLSFTSDSLTVNLGGSWQNGNRAVIQILTNQNPVSAESVTWGSLKALYQ